MYLLKRDICSPQFHTLWEEKFFPTKRHIHQNATKKATFVVFFVLFSNCTIVT